MNTELLQNIEAERQILGNILMRLGKTYCEAASIIGPDDLYHPVHRAIFATMASMDAEQVQIDCLTLWDALRARREDGGLRSLGESKYLAQLVTDCIAVEGVEFYARAVMRKSRRRKWALACAAIAASSEADDNAFCEHAEQAVLAISIARTDSKPVGIKPALHLVSKALGERYERKDKKIIGITTGFADLDWLTQGLQDSELTILAARPSMGKSALALNLASAASLAGAAGLFFSLEMSTEALVRRLASMESRVDSLKLRSANLAPVDWTNFTAAINRLADRPLWFDDASALSIAEIRSRARRWRMTEARDHQSVFIVVDYLQLARSPSENKQQSREREIADISAGLKGLAKQLRCPVLALSQLNRSVESRADRRPMLSDLRESGSIEQDADVVAFLYRDEVYDKQTKKPGVAEVIVAKQRDGMTGTIDLGWQGQYTRFVNLEANK